jgi:sialic acid synthase SpsE|tara:strand:- start:2435 stop:3166 length:732 start_codon:yes stop_codon:yes gene_type:complete
MKAFVVAEIASNWEGSLAKAQKLITESKKAGADAVKFQMWRAKDLYDKNHPNWNEIKKSELTFEQIKKIKKFADRKKIELFCSVFYPGAINFLQTLNIKRYKVASRTCLLKDPFAMEVLKLKADTKKPIIISMGMGGNKKQIKRIFSGNQVTFCYCISEYPTAYSKIRWNEAKKYDGFSDHTLGIIAPIIFTILKKQQGVKNIIIEKHVKLKGSKGPDASSSLEISKLAEMIQMIRKIETLKN